VYPCVVDVLQREGVLYVRPGKLDNVGSEWPRPRR
jgi:hypothetical protein